MGCGFSREETKGGRDKSAAAAAIVGNGEPRKGPRSSGGRKDGGFSSEVTDGHEDGEKDYEDDENEGELEGKKRLLGIEKGYCFPYPPFLDFLVPFGVTAAFKLFEFLLQVVLLLLPVASYFLKI